MKSYAALNALRKYPSFIVEQLAKHKEEGYFFAEIEQVLRGKRDK